MRRVCLGALAAVWACCERRRRAGEVFTLDGKSCGSVELRIAAAPAVA
jgi:hypothetical protein